MAAERVAAHHVATHKYLTFCWDVPFFGLKAGSPTHLWLEKSFNAMGQEILAFHPEDTIVL